jgi:hypothetical protein
MSREKEITDFITDLASHLKAKVGHKPDSVVGVPDVSETMHVDDRTVRNYAGGLTTGSMTIESFARFGAEFRGELPDLTDRAIDLLCKVFGGHFQRDGVEDKTFLDANGDGRTDHRDIPGHAAEAAKVMVSETLEGDETPCATRRESSRERCHRVSRHIRAVERLVR